MVVEPELAMILDQIKRTNEEKVEDSMASESEDNNDVRGFQKRNERYMDS